MGEQEPVAHIDPVLPLILVIRDQRVILDSDLASLYGVTNKRLKEQVRRNRERFPSDFAFQLTKMEKMEVAANCGHLEKIKYSRWLPYAFTEHGAIMAANVVNSKRAVEMSVFVVRAFVQMRESLATTGELRARIDELELRTNDHDDEISAIIETIRRLVDSGASGPKRIGFRSRCDQE